MITGEVFFNALVALQSFLGVESYPKEPSPDWEIVQEWTKVAEDQYELVLSSTSLPESCSKNTSALVEFPLIQMGLHEIFVDKRLTYTSGSVEDNAPDSIFGTPTLPCAIFVNGEKVVWKVKSFSKYLSVLTFYPRVISFPYINFFNLYLYYVGSGILLTLVFLFLFSFLGKAPIQIVLSNSFLCLMGTIMVSTYGTIAVFLKFTGFTVLKVTATLMWTTFIVLLNTYPYSSYLNKKIRWSLSAMLSLLVSLCWLLNEPNFNQIVILVPVPGSLSIIAWYIYKVITNGKWNYFVAARVTMLLASLAVFSNDYMGTLLFNTPYYLLPVGVVCLMLFQYLSLSEEVSSSLKQRDFFEKNNELNSALLDKIQKYQEGLKLKIHDLKSPLSAIKIGIPEDNQLLKKAMSRIDKILDNNLGRGIVDYYPFSRLVEKLESLVLEKKLTCSQGQRIELSRKMNEEEILKYSVLIDSDQLIRTISNLINNSTDAIGSEGAIELSYFLKDEQIAISIQDTGGGIPEEIIKKVLQSGYTTKSSGWGIGLSSSVKVISSWGGFIEVKNTSIGLSIEVLLKTTDGI